MSIFKHKHNFNIYHMKSIYQLFSESIQSNEFKSNEVNDDVIDVQIKESDIKESDNDVILEDFDDLDELDESLICETLNSDILRKLAKQLKDNYQERKKKDEESGWGSYTRNTQFKQVFGNNGIDWNAITDDKITYIPKDEVENKENMKLIRNVIKGNTHNILLLYNPNTKKFDYFINTFGGMNYLTDREAGNAVGIRLARSWKDLPQYEKIKRAKQYDIYVIDAAGADTFPKRQARQEARQGMVLLDEYSLKQKALENREKYKKIVSQNKALRQNNDELLTQAGEIVKQACDVAIKVAKDPVKYADAMYNVSSLTQLIYSRKTTSYSKFTRKYETYGADGILPMIAKYSEAMKKSASSSSDYTTNEIEYAKKTLKEDIEKAEALLEKIHVD